MAEFRMKNKYESGEEFYQDLKKHLIEDGVIPKNPKWEHYEPQRDYFKVALDYFHKSNIVYNAYYTSSLTIWEHIRCLVYSYFGVKVLQQMKLEWKEEANNKAIEIMRLLEKGE